MATRSSGRSRPWRPLAALAVIIVVMLVSVTATGTFHPGRWQQQFKVALGLDLSGGTEMVLQAQAPQGHPPSAAEMSQAAAILLSRVNATGTTGAQVQQQGADMLDVSAPGASANLLNQVSGTAQMRFRPVLLWAPPAGKGAAAAAAAPSGDASRVSAATMRLFSELKCTPGPDGNVNDDWKATVGYTPQQAQWDNPGAQVVACDASGAKYVLDKAVFKGTDVTAANAGLLPGSGQWTVNLTLDGAAAQAFGTLTTTQFDNYYPSAASNQDDAVLDQTAMALDGDVVSAPQTTVALTSGEFRVSGPDSAPFTQAQADQLANQLKYGALPLSFKLLTLRAISAALGHAALAAGLTAGATGLGLTVAYLFAYYRGLGLVSVSSLLLAALLSYLALVLLSRHQGLTLSLSGIAGLIVAIGITADSFIVFFERLRDELRDGRALRPAVERGWRRARRTILLSDTVSLIAAVLLYHFAISDVQGFAFTLGLTTLVDVIVVFLFTRPAMTVLAGTTFFGGGHPWSGLDPARLNASAPWRSSSSRARRPARSSAEAPSAEAPPAEAP
jgi:preprotein translocase subunit SecD